MNRSTVGNRWNLDLLEENHARWRNDPASVDESWRVFFEGYELGRTGSGNPVGNGAATLGPSDASASADPDATRAQSGVTRLIDAYREIGHHLADLDPLRLNPVRETDELLALSNFGLTDADMDRVFFNPFTDPPYATLRQLLRVLRETYCRKIGVEYMHIRNPQVRQWMQERMEPKRNRPGYDLRRKRRIILKLNAAELFETFLSTHYVGQKRFSLEGGEILDTDARRRWSSTVGTVRGPRDRAWAWPTAAGSTSWPTP